MVLSTLNAPLSALEDLVAFTSTRSLAAKAHIENTVVTARSLFNYLVPMLQDKRAEEEEQKRGGGLGLTT
jgi:hypothetical protein